MQQSYVLVLRDHTFAFELKLQIVQKVVCEERTFFYRVFHDTGHLQILAKSQALY